jgi:hypothetical protein
MAKTTKRTLPGIFVHGIPGRDYDYPAWRYHEFHEPIVVHSTEEDEKYKGMGYINAKHQVTTACRYLLNWRFDLEDFSPRQLAQFAKDEFEGDLPIQAGSEELFKCLYRLHTSDPRNQENIVLMAHSIRMEYDATCKYIKDVAEFGKIPEGCEVEVITEEFIE